MTEDHMGHDAHTLFTLLATIATYNLQTAMLTMAAAPHHLAA